MKTYRLGSNKPILGTKDICYKCGCDMIVTNLMIKQRLFWCSDCRKAHVNKYSEQKRARQKVRDAIRYGKMVKGCCEKCGNPKTSAHHKDYSQPLNVNWLCHTCHMGLHKELRSTHKSLVHRKGTLIHSVAIMNVGDTISVPNKKPIVISCLYTLRKFFNEVDKKFKLEEADGQVIINRIK